MASESLQCKVLTLMVSIHCEGCKKKVKKVLQRVEGVYRCDVDGRSNRATVTVTGKVSADILVRKLRRAGKHAEQWREEQQKQQQPGGGQCPEETKNQAAEPDKSGDPAEPEKPACGDAAEPSDPKAPPEEPKKTAGEGAAPAEDGGTESTDANDSGSGSAGDSGGVEMVTAHQPSEPNRRRKQQQPPQQEEKAGEATMATAASTQGSHFNHFPATLPQQQPVHVMNYNVARPSSSAAYYAAAPAAAPASAARPPPPLQPQEEHSYAYSPYGYYNNYYGRGQRTPQRSLASPARNSYGDLFSDDNANSCSVM